jgi:hypothetical protein
MDYWAGTFGLVVFALIESIIFMWIFGAEKAWQEINAGAEIKIPKLFFYIMKYVTPTLLLIVMIWWLINDAIPILLMKNVTPANVPYIWGARVFMLGSLGVLFYLIHLSWKKKGENN